MKMMSATLARIGALRFDAMPFGFLFALRAGIILAKARFKDVIQAGFIVAKLSEKFPNRHAVFIAVVPVLHALNIRLKAYVCQGDNSVDQRWAARITMPNGKRRHIGLFMDEKNAASAYDAHALSFGYKKTNFCG